MNQGPVVKERPILFSAPMVRALLAGTKTQTRRIVKPQPFKPDPSRPSYFPFQPEDWVWSANSWSSTISNSPEGPAGWAKHCPCGQPGDRLWVRETFQPLFADGMQHGDEGIDWGTGAGYAVRYTATDKVVEWVDGDDEVTSRCKPSIHMPRWASRLTLEITSVRVERLQSISEADAAAEGIEHQPNGGELYPHGEDRGCGGRNHYRRIAISGNQSTAPDRGARILGCGLSNLSW